MPSESHSTFLFSSGILQSRKMPQPGQKISQKKIYSNIPRVDFVGVVEKISIDTGRPLEHSLPMVQMRCIIGWQNPLTTLSKPIVVVLVWSVATIPRSSGKILSGSAVERRPQDEMEYSKSTGSVSMIRVGTMSDRNRINSFSCTNHFLFSWFSVLRRFFSDIHFSIASGLSWRENGFDRIGIDCLSS